MKLVNLIITINILNEITCTLYSDAIVPVFCITTSICPYRVDASNVGTLVLKILPGDLLYIIGNYIK